MESGDGEPGAHAERPRGGAAMSAVPSSLPHELEVQTSGAPKLAPKASLYFLLVAAAAAATVVPLISNLSPRTSGWTTFLILGACAATAQLFVVRMPRLNQSYHTTIVFLMPAVMLLPPELVALVGVVHHLPEWLKTRSAWYIQIFNICNWTLSMLAAYASFHAVLRIGSGSELEFAFAGFGAAAAIVGINHALIAPMLLLARGHSLRESGLFSFPSLSTDLDLLRDINNTYGHLAGDAVLQGIAGVFRDQLREYDVPARFGGEEFAILLPETPPEQAFEIAERIRRAVAERTFDVETSSEPIRATVSIGVAAYPRDGSDVNELIHQADLAVYRAKLQGRNRVLDASAEPLLMPAKRQVPTPEASDQVGPL